MCPAGYVQEKTGESACVSLNWVHAEDCERTVFERYGESHVGNANPA